MRKIFFALLLGSTFSALVASADQVPLPPWQLTLGVGAGGSADTNTVYLSHNYAAQASASAISTNDILTVAPYTTYTLSTMAKVVGPGYTSVYLLVNNVDAGSLYFLGGSPDNPYGLHAVSFTTGGAEDSRVGQPLKVRLDSQFNSSGAYAHFTQIKLEATSAIPPNPTLAIVSAASSQVAISWSTNYPSFQLEAKTDASNTWSSVTNAPVIQGDKFVLILGAQSAQSYFRLRQ